MFKKIKEAVNTFVNENAREPKILAMHYEDYCDFKNEFVKENGFDKNRNIIFELTGSVRIGGGVSSWEIFIIRTTDVPKNTYALI